MTMAAGAERIWNALGSRACWRMWKRAASIAWWSTRSIGSAVRCSLLDFTRLLSLFEKRGVSFVSVTQEFNTSSSMGRLTLHILLSFAQFEREIIGERTRDKLSAARRKGKWIGGVPVLGYDVAPAGGRLLVNAAEAERVRDLLRYAPVLPA
jgi:DNA invertase Pin-like site-specific DNA recombinase